MKKMNKLDFFAAVLTGLLTSPAHADFASCKASILSRLPAEPDAYILNMQQGADKSSNGFGLFSLLQGKYQGIDSFTADLFDRYVFAGKSLYLTYDPAGTLIKTPHQGPVEMGWMVVDTNNNSGPFNYVPLTSGTVGNFPDALQYAKIDMPKDANGTLNYWFRAQTGTDASGNPVYTYDKMDFRNYIVTIRATPSGEICLPADFSGPFLDGTLKAGGSVRVYYDTARMRAIIPQAIAKATSPTFRVETALNTHFYRDQSSNSIGSDQQNIIYYLSGGQASQDSITAPTVNIPRNTNSLKIGIVAWDSTNAYNLDQGLGSDSHGDGTYTFGVTQ